MQTPDGIYMREMKHLTGCSEITDISRLCSLLPHHYTLSGMLRQQFKGI